MYSYISDIVFLITISLADWAIYFKELLNNNNSTGANTQQKISLSGLIPQYCRRLQRPSMVWREIRLHHLTDALKDGGEEMTTFIHAFCQEVYVKNIAPSQWITNLIVPVPKKGNLTLKTNYRGITLMSMAAKVYNKILLNRIRPLNCRTDSAPKPGWFSPRP